MKSFEGIVGVENFKIHCIIGNNAEERLMAQDVFVDIRVTLDFSRSSQSSSLNDTVDYVELAKICLDLATTRQYRIMETFAAEALQRMLDTFAIHSAWIRIKKPSALANASYTFVELEKHRDR